MKEIELHAGTHISEASKQAVEEATRLGETVKFTFNGVEVLVFPSDSASKVESRWHVDFEDSQRRWRESPAGIAFAEQAKLDEEKSRRAIGRIVRGISARPDMDGTIRLLAELSEVAHVKVDVHYPTLAAMLVNAGYVENEFVGHEPQSDFDENKQITGRYIIGQAINCMKIGMPPHPMTAVFAERYFRI